MTTGDQVRISTASAIDLAGSEDNRRTENGKERMIESASINKSLFTLAKCVEAIGRGDDRIPYRESKMTRILSLGQNDGVTIMILNLAPIRSYHLDTLSSLNFANRTKKVETREIENEPVFKGCTRAVPSSTESTVQRQPLRPLASTVHNASTHAANTIAARPDKQSKAFSVYSDKARSSAAAARHSQSTVTKLSSPVKRASETVPFAAWRPAKRPMHVKEFQPVMSKQAIEDMIDRKVSDMLATKALDQPSIAAQPEISEEVQRRLDVLEKKIEGKEDGREQGLAYLLMAKQHAVRGEDLSALRMYTLAKDFFPENQKLETKIEKLREKIEQRKLGTERRECSTPAFPVSNRRSQHDGDGDYESAPGDDHNSESDVNTSSKGNSKRRNPLLVAESFGERTPRTLQLLDIVNTRDITQIRMLKGVGPKKAAAIVEALIARGCEGESQIRNVASLRELSTLRGVGSKTVENMRAGF